MDVLSPVFETTTLVVLGVILLLDLLYVARRPHEPSMKEAGLWIGFYVALALVFAGLLFALGDAQHGTEFLAGWVTEYSLSVDNLFVFLIIMAKFQVPRRYQQEVLMVGIIIALIARAVFIAVGAVAIEHLTWVFYIFGAFLLWTAWQQLKDDGEDEESEPGVVARLTRRLNVAPDYDGNRLRTTVDGRRMFTPMVVVFITIGLTDVMFAVDSIPAIFGLTQNWFIVLTANIFALMGLRQLYFLLGGLMDRLVFLKHGLAFILAFIGVKLVFHALHENELPFINGGHPVTAVPEISTFVSLGVILGTLVLATVASLIWGRTDRESASPLTGQVQRMEDYADRARRDDR
ncbi:MULTISPECIES: TerC family protein [Micrococcus]|uniref:TerC family protein n=1 Tax=Micrococcus TaxID=1269 RepID=UPI0001C4FD18|nr:TerC family protein [Micrococcus luteus]PFH07390.1 tellurite resistance protein TerC [Micrococcaceae bacterium JKS001869]EFD51019.1 integral membrane protein, TerC family [Micrococcus luteus SK58]KWW41214.1 putative membrane protein [Micrococcus luteus]MCV7510791.1 TerC family protein [Micrococcus luteus]MCV7519491.1 TerC family protein [Micrococcus luteus]